MWLTNDSDSFKLFLLVDSVGLSKKKINYLLFHFIYKSVLISSSLQMDSYFFFLSTSICENHEMYIIQFGIVWDWTKIQFRISLEKRRSKKKNANASKRKLVIALNKTQPKHNEQWRRCKNGFLFDLKFPFTFMCLVIRQTLNWNVFFLSFFHFLFFFFIALEPFYHSLNSIEILN